MAVKGKSTTKFKKVGSVEEALGNKSFRPETDEPTVMSLDSLPKEKETKAAKPNRAAAPEAVEPAPEKVQKSVRKAVADEDVDPVDDSVSNAQVMRGLAKTVQALADSTPRRVLLANHKPRSSFNPLGKRKRKLNRRMYQNGFPLDVNKLTDEEISLLNQIKPGRYVKGLVTVLETHKGQDTLVNIVYVNKTVDQRFALKDEFRKFVDLLKLILDEERNPPQTDEDDDDDE